MSRELGPKCLFIGWYDDFGLISQGEADSCGKMAVRVRRGVEEWIRKEHADKITVLLAAATGLRVSELLALKWGDIKFDSLEISLNRGVVHQVIGDLKTEASRKPLPLDPDLAQSLLVSCPY